MKKGAVAGSVWWGQSLEQGREMADDYRVIVRAEASASEGYVRC